jgi:hypothetical protein
VRQTRQDTARAISAMTHAWEDRGTDEAIGAQRGTAPLVSPLVFSTGLEYRPFALQSVHHHAYSAGHGDGVPDNHGDARGILEKRDTTPATV